MSDEEIKREMAETMGIDPDALSENAKRALDAFTELMARNGVTMPPRIPQQDLGTELVAKTIEHMDHDILKVAAYYFQAGQQPFAFILATLVMTRWACQQHGEEPLVVYTEMYDRLHRLFVTIGQMPEGTKPS